jgi:hypothetical protein
LRFTEQRRIGDLAHRDLACQFSFLDGQQSFFNGNLAGPMFAADAE